MRYYIADCHFFHGELNDNMDHRGFASIEEMNAYMLKKWNAKVRPNDEVIILGDLSWGKPEETNELLSKLNGRLYLIIGNHDRFHQNHAYRTDRFVWMKHYEELKDYKRKIILSNYPIMCYNGQYYRNEKGEDKTYMLYGHVHDTTDQRLIEQFHDITISTVRTGRDGKEMHIPCNMINCFCMYSDYTPLTLDEWIVCNRERLQKQQKKAERI